MSRAPRTDDDPRLGLDFVFVVTYARSGSTLLQALLNACPGVTIRGENNAALYHLYRATDALQETHSVRGRQNLANAPDMPWFGADIVDASGFETRALNAFVRRVLAPPVGTKVSGFKEIRYTPAYIPRRNFAPYMEFLLSRFPRSKIVFNSRRGEDVAKSGFLAHTDSAQVKAQVATCDAQFKSYAAGSDRAIHMQYEDWVADHTRVHDMLTFLGLDWSAEDVERVMAKQLNHAKRKA